jgi:glucosamine 6-phosphate synthetase-like amidotransferase/phosphosugar isomerase protein
MIYTVSVMARRMPLRWKARSSSKKSRMRTAKACSPEFKHGPLSAVREGYPVIFISGPDDVPLLVSGINETACRGGHTIAIGVEDDRLRANAQTVIVLPPSSPLLSPILSVLPLQLLSYQLALAAATIGFSIPT